MSKNWFLAHVAKHLPEERTGLEEEHEVHWLKEPPEQVAQSGWQERQAPDAEKVLEGHVETHLPWDASWLFAHVRQNVEEPAQEPQEESQAVRKID